MHTYQIAPSVLENYVTNKLSNERIEFLKNQANEQIQEISQSQDLYNRFLKEVDAPEQIDNSVLWILFMSNEDIVEEYIDEFSKNYREIIPVSDLADLLLHAVYLNNIEKIELDGFDYLLDYDEDGKNEVDQYAFMNVLLYTQRSKEADLGF